jgi:ubiquinone/menaquinone biosynthesis C-methylase UbiE
MRRVPSQEWLDDDLGTPEEIRQSFDDLWRINRWLGGVSGCLRLLDQYFARTGCHHARILDVGSGDSRLAVHLHEELAKRNLSAEFVAFDRRLNHLKSGNHSPQKLSRVVGDAFDLPFRCESFDVVMCNLFLHHFSGDQAKKIFRCLGEVASKAVLINDLERHPLPYFFIRFALPFARSRVTRHDGPASVRQAYTREELGTLVRQAGFSNFEIEQLAAFRLGLTVWKT